VICRFNRVAPQEKAAALGSGFLDVLNAWWIYTARIGMDLRSMTWSIKPYSTASWADM
jgi:hypothetical protein